MSCVSWRRSRPPPPGRLIRSAVVGSPIGAPSARVYVGFSVERSYLESVSEAFLSEDTLTCEAMFELE